jgi:trk system potassium uptake protein TrkA
VGRTLGDAQVRKRYGITVVCIKPAGGSFTYATQETAPGPDDILVVAGETGRVQGFADLG